LRGGLVMYDGWVCFLGFIYFLVEAGIGYV